mmetsp:Transcript_16262/g.39316  ORF Transcript_16262/g.39316 Transcript_16262/m.39316 type:complete len:112 (-) Transcript_16262:102-437(-)
MRAVLMVVSLGLGLRVDSMEESTAMLVTHSGMAVATSDESAEDIDAEDSGLPCRDNSQCGTHKNLLPSSCQNKGVRVQCPVMCGACKSPGAVGHIGFGGEYHTTRAPVTLR